MLLPFQGANPNIYIPRALPWAGCLLAFQAVTSQKVYRTPIVINTHKKASEYHIRSLFFMIAIFSTRSPFPVHR